MHAALPWQKTTTPSSSSEHSGKSVGPFFTQLPFDEVERSVPSIAAPQNTTNFEMEEENYIVEISDKEIRCQTQ